MSPMLKSPEKENDTSGRCTRDCYAEKIREGAFNISSMKRTAEMKGRSCARFRGCLSLGEGIYLLVYGLFSFTQSIVIQ